MTFLHICGKASRWNLSIIDSIKVKFCLLTWANFVRDIIIIAFLWQLVCPLNSVEIRGTITSRSDKKLLEVWLDSERGGESINSLIDFIA